MLLHLNNVYFKEIIIFLLLCLSVHFETGPILKLFNIFYFLKCFLNFFLTVKTFQ